MARIDAMKYYESLPKETQELITNVMFSTIDMCNELLDTKLVYFEDVAYRVMRADMLEHMLNGEWFDALGDRTWKKHGEVTSWDGKFPIKNTSKKEEAAQASIAEDTSKNPRYIRFTKEIDYWLEMVELDGKIYDVLDDSSAWDRLRQDWPTIINDKDEIELIIDITDGRITNWPPEKPASFRTVKIVDTGFYELLSEDRTVLHSIRGYVPDFLSIESQPDGDYLEFDVNSNGYINNWKFTDSDLETINKEWN